MQILKYFLIIAIRDSLMVRMGACRVPDRGSIPRRGDYFFKYIFFVPVGMFPNEHEPPRFDLFDIQPNNNNNNYIEMSSVSTVSNLRNQTDRYL